MKKYATDLVKIVTQFQVKRMNYDFKCFGINFNLNCFVYLVKSRAKHFDCVKLQHAHSET